MRERFPAEDQFAAQAGVCFVTCASGKSRGAGFRRAGKKRLRLAVTCCADRILARAWIRVL